ncbi:MAG: hypothetical protein J6V25_11310 [Oscillospiraceae bacterium]|nr:hypothetical protein [Oscillospiraceae bacterium]
MKKFVSVVMAMTLSVSMLAGCGSKTPAETTVPETTQAQPAVPETTVPEETAPAVAGEGTLEEMLNQVIAVNPVEFMGGVIPVDLTDTSEDGLWALKSYTGLDNADSIVEAAAYEPMMGSIAFSMVMVRVAEGADAQAVAAEMKAGIDTRKWICVEANEVMAAGYGDVVMFIMLDNTSGMSAQSFVDAFQSVVGAELDFVI